MVKKGDARQADPKREGIYAEKPPPPVPADEPPHQRRRHGTLPIGAAPSRYADDPFVTGLIQRIHQQEEDWNNLIDVCIGGSPPPIAIGAPPPLTASSTSSSSTGSRLFFAASPPPEASPRVRSAWISCTSKSAPSPFSKAGQH